MNKTIRILFVFSLLLNVILLAFLFCNSMEIKDNKDYFNFSKYKYSNIRPDDNGIPNAVFIGNSITENWMNVNPGFFYSNGYICRGTGGQTSSQLLLRFHQDVVSLKPQIVVINAGTNDIAGGDGFYDLEFTLNNIKSMVDIAHANDIAVILTAVLPAKEYKTSYFNTVTDVQPKIDELNNEIKLYAKAKNISFADFNELMRDDKGYIKESMTFDGVHPNIEGYKVMELLIKAVMDNILTE